MNQREIKVFFLCFTIVWITIRKLDPLLQMQMRIAWARIQSGEYNKKKRNKKKLRRESTLCPLVVWTSCLVLEGGSSVLCLLATHLNCFLVLFGRISGVRSLPSLSHYPGILCYVMSQSGEKKKRNTVQMVLWRLGGHIGKCFKRCGICGRNILPAFSVVCIFAIGSRWRGILQKMSWNHFNKVH